MWRISEEPQVIGDPFESELVRQLHNSIINGSSGIIDYMALYCALKGNNLVVNNSTIFGVDDAKKNHIHSR
jgi:hypothetical protein